MKRIVACAAAFLLAATMMLSAFAAGSVTSVIEVTPVKEEVETTYTTESGKTETGKVQVTATPDAEVAASKEEVAQIETAAGEGQSLVNVFEISVTVTKGEKEEKVTRNTTVEVNLNVYIPEGTNVSSIVLVGYVKTTGRWENIPSGQWKYSIRNNTENGLNSGVLTVSLDPKYSKVAVTTSF